MLYSNSSTSCVFTGLLEFHAVFKSALQTLI